MGFITEKTFIVSESMIVWAFRYALGRKTYVVGDVVSCLKMYWSHFKPSTQKQIQEEIQEALEEGRAGADCDIKNWKEVLNFQNG